MRIRHVRVTIAAEGVPCHASMHEPTISPHAAAFILLIPGSIVGIHSSACERTLADEIKRICKGEPRPKPRASARPTVKP